MRIFRWGCWILGLGLVLMAGCDFAGRDNPEEVRLLLEGTAGRQVRLITTSNFIAQQQGIFDNAGIRVGDTTLVQLFTADTQVVSLPFEQVFDIRRPQRFFAKTVRLSPRSDQLRMQGWIDGRRQYDKTPTDVEADTLLQFIYFFNGAGRQPGEPPDV